MKDLKEKVAVVTGGAGGIGLGIARALAGAGTHLIIADIQEDKAARAAAGLAETGVRTSAWACDVSDHESVERLADRAWSEYGGVDLIFNNAGVMSGLGPLVEAKEGDLRWLLEVNLIGVWNGCSVFGRRFLEQGGPAHIVNTGSEHSLCAAHPLAGFYTATKHAVLALSDVLRLELPEFIQVSILCCGLVATDIAGSMENRPDEFGGPEKLDPALAERDVSRLGMDPDEVGQRTVDGVRRGDFYIVTHPHDIVYVEERNKEILAAFASQAPRYQGDDSYDVRKIMARMAGQ
jgi:NAD(P)-dependent dehydrogenase (short-subunit alcohol dehydrogenase family)